MIIFGHRGAPGFPRVAENTRASFQKAVAAGATGLEFDVRRCADGRLVIVHDDVVRHRSYEELCRIDVPLLSDVLDEFGSRCLLNIELKDAGIAADVKSLVLQRRLEGHVIVSSFDWNELRSFVPEVPIGLLSWKLENLLSSASELHATAIHLRRDIVTRTLIAAAHEQGLLVYVWTVNDLDEVVRFRDLGVDGIFTDFPERCSTLAS